MPRNVKIASCAVDFAGYPATRAAALAMLEEACRLGPDIVCLPEFSACEVVAGKQAPQPIPGPTLDPFSRLAERHRAYVIVPLLEAAEGVVYNTAVLLDRQGRMAGKYRKTHLCLPGHAEGETTMAGDETPVFRTDFGVIGLTLCMDLHYPELYTVLALRGAEVIFWPSGALDYTGDLIESLVNARAVDNQVYFVCSHFCQQPYLAGRHYGRSRVVDCMGRIRADTGHFPGVAMAAVDLDQTYPMWYEGAMLGQYPSMRETLFRTRRPDLYHALTEPVQPQHYCRGPAASPPGSA